MSIIDLATFKTLRTVVNDSVVVKTVKKLRKQVFLGDCEYWETTVDLVGWKSQGDKDNNYTIETAALWHNITVCKLKLFYLEEQYASKAGVQEIGQHSNDPDSAIAPFVSYSFPKL